MNEPVKNPIDGSTIVWPNNSYTRDNLPGLHFQAKQKRASLDYVLEKGCNVLDAGAHIGDYSVPLAHALKNIHREDIVVYCIDPCVKKCKFIETVSKINNINNIKIINTGLSNVESTYSVCQTGMSRKNIKNTGAWQYKQSSSGEKFTTLDTLWQSGLLDSIGFFWLDAQWMEYEILVGGEKFLNTFKPYILMEYWPVDRYAADGVTVAHSHPGTVSEFISDNKFKLFLDKHNIHVKNTSPDISDILLEFA